MGLRILVLVLILILGTGSAMAGDYDAWGVYSMRSSWFRTPINSQDVDRDYGLGHARLRGYASHKTGDWKFLGAVQAAASVGLPKQGFGIGPVYYLANGITTPGRISLMELNASFSRENFGFEAGRMKYADGAEANSGNAYLKGVKKARLMERLIGNWDWVNVGRRFDGVKGGGGNKDAWLHGFFLQPLAGGVNYREAYEWLDDLLIYGGSATAKYNGWIPNTEARVFAYRYDDKRDGAKNASGGDIALTTFGASAIWGTDNTDLLGWFAYQTGDWGEANQKAYAYILEAGHKHLDGKHKPYGRIGLAQASGQDDSEDRTTFFNMMPTNHKFYGSMDYNAFSNLRDVYLILGGEITERLSLKMAGHMFWLPEKGDAWYGGSGAFNQSLLGYAGRRPGSGDFTSDKLANEFDFDLQWKASKNTTLKGGGAKWWGGEASKQITTVAPDGFWGYVMAVIKIS